MISIIIRTRNEERWIGVCLRAVRRQKIDEPIEVVLVDNASTDKTVERAKALWPNLVLVRLDHFRPGFAINEGIRAARGDYLVCLSAHCPPVEETWLANLRRHLDDPQVAGVYGRQVPTRFSSPVDKRDLFLTFGTERRVQESDSFFHNANSIIPRWVWERFPFDETTTNIEDRLWGKEVICAGLRIVYEPEAAVFHHHGIHQDNHFERARNIVEILESRLPELSPAHFGSPFDPADQDICAILPLKGQDNSIDFEEILVGRTIESIRSSTLVGRIFAATDSTRIRDMVSEMGVEVPFLRPPELSGSTVRVDEVLQNYFRRLEAEGYFPDVIVPLEVTYPFRPATLIDEAVNHLLNEGCDSVIAGLQEYRACWRRIGTGFEAVTDTNIGRQQRQPLHIGVPGLVCATYPEMIRNGTRIGRRVNIIEIDDPLAGIEVRTREDYEILARRMVLGPDRPRI